MARSRSWRNIIKKPLSLNEVAEILRGLGSLSDQGVAVVCTSLFERGLERAILARLSNIKLSRRKELFEGGGPLSSLFAKMRIAYGLSIFGDHTYSDLDKLREIRNVFAHSTHTVRFSTPRIASHCLSLRICDHNVVPAQLVILGWLDLHVAARDRGKVAAMLQDPRRRFIYAATLYWLLFSTVETKRPVRSRDSFTRRYLC